ncbi:hypothetical protein BS78_07G025800 [Paspalum vaginatum]|nr:hypothetical protein BS78_07G025800 [Paspalum vaginatum]
MIFVPPSLIFTVLVAGDCSGSRTNMTMEQACRAACGNAAAGEPMHQFCMVTLRDDDTHAGSIDKAGEYAYRAAWRALWAYLDTLGRAWHLLGNAPLAGEEKAAYWFCVGGRPVPGGQGGHGQRHRYRTALRDVKACRDRLLAKLPSSPLLTMVEADDKRTLLAYLLCKLL